MFSRLFFLGIVSLCFLGEGSAYMTFKNAIVTCEIDNAEEEAYYAISITGKRLKPHLRSDQSCTKVTIESPIPIVYDGAFEGVSRVSILSLDKNGIKEIHPGAFRNSKVGQILSLKSNKLTRIRRGVFNDVLVPFLYLSHNTISFIEPGAFDDMINLRNIYLDHNSLSYYDSEWFKNTPQLRKLIFQHNSIRYVPIQSFKNLEMSATSAPSIDLSHNKINRVNVDALKKDGGRSWIHYLSLAHNQIQDLSPDWLAGVEMRILDLSHNQIRCLGSDTLTRGDSVNYLDGNPWDCTCLKDIREFIGYGKIETSACPSNR